MFLLVLAHPGCPGQIPQSRKTVVCVCVYLLTRVVPDIFQNSSKMVVCVCVSHAAYALQTIKLPLAGHVTSPLIERSLLTNVLMMTMGNT